MTLPPELTTPVTLPLFAFGLALLSAFLFGMAFVSVLDWAIRRARQARFEARLKKQKAGNAQGAAE